MLEQSLINGLVVGSIYTLVALGLTIIFSIMRIVNFAHGEIYMLGAFGTYFLATIMGLNYWVALILAMAFTFMIGTCIERLCFRPLYKKPEINMFLVSIGLISVLQYGASFIWGPDERSLNSPLKGKILSVGSISISYERFIVIVISAGLILFLYFFIKRSRWGKGMRAVAQNPEAAAIFGIRQDIISSFSFSIGSALAGMAGGLIGPIFMVSPEMGASAVMKAFVVIILGGLGSIEGAVIGGYLLGVIESLAGGYLFFEYKDAVGFIILIIILLIRPKGLLGS